jgi:hypothetical protein
MLGHSFANPLQIIWLKVYEHIREISMTDVLVSF